MDGRARTHPSKILHAIECCFLNINCRLLEFRYVIERKNIEITINFIREIHSNFDGWFWAASTLWSHQFLCSYWTSNTSFLSLSFFMFSKGKSHFVFCSDAKKKKKKKKSIIVRRSTVTRTLYSGRFENNPMAHSYARIHCLNFSIE